MVFYLVGLGLGDVKDITVKGLEIVQKCSEVYLESYTSILCYGLDRTRLEEFYGRPVLEADRDLVEQGVEKLLEAAKNIDIALLVVGDPFGATTHSDLVLRAKRIGVDVKPVHNASIMNAVGCCGLQLYSFGETVSIVMWTDGWQPDSYFDKILRNFVNGLHTLCLLDIKTKEQSVENLMKGKKVYELPRYQTASQAAQQLLTIIERRKHGPKSADSVALDEQSPVVGLARVGWEDQKIIFCSLREMASVDLGPPLHALVILAKSIHPIELEFLQTFAL